MSIKNKYLVKSIDSYLCKEWILKKHYAKRLPNIQYSFGLFTLENLMIGCCTFGQPPSNNIQLCCGEKYKNKTIELNRLIKNDGLEKNIQSFFVSQCFKLLPKPMIIISYSDPNYGHNGYTYQALNFYYTGKGGETKEYIFNNHRYNSRHIKDYWFKNKNLEYDNKLNIDENFINCGGKINKVEFKNRYIYFLGTKKEKIEMKKLLKYKILPYPKGDNLRYDASYMTINQTSLF